MMFRGGSRMISEGVRFNQITVLYKKTGLSKQYRPRLVQSGSTLFATHPAILYTFIESKIDLLKRSVR